MDAKIEGVRKVAPPHQREMKFAERGREGRVTGREGGGERLGGWGLRGERDCVCVVSARGRACEHAAGLGPTDSAIP